MEFRWAASTSLTASGADLPGIARRGAEAVLKQIFEHRFFHSDPHGDNILITPEGGIVFLDFGQTGYHTAQPEAFSGRSALGPHPR